MIHCRGNQSRAAEILGMNRATLRKKLKQYAVSEG
jgi:Fis family transcriptional regulator